MAIFCNTSTSINRIYQLASALVPTGAIIVCYTERFRVNDFIALRTLKEIFERQSLEAIAIRSECVFWNLFIMININSARHKKKTFRYLETWYQSNHWATASQFFHFASMILLVFFSCEANTFSRVPLLIVGVCLRFSTFFIKKSWCFKLGVVGTVENA